MKKLTALLLLVVLVFGLAGCKEQEKQKDTGERKEQEELPGNSVGGDGAANGNTMPVPDLTEGPILCRGIEEYAAAYDGDREVFPIRVEYALVTETGYEEVTARLMELNRLAYKESRAAEEIALDHLAEVDSANGGFFSSVTLRRSDSVIVSFEREVYRAIPGLEDHYTKGYTINTATGDLLELSDAVKDMDGFCKALLKKPYEAEHELVDGWEEKAEKLFREGAYGWVYRSSQIDVWFASSELEKNPDKGGIVSFSISAEDAPELFDDRYIGAYGEYTVRKREKNEPEEKRSPFFENVMTVLIRDGFEEMDFEEVDELLRQNGITYPETVEIDKLFREESVIITVKDPATNAKAQFDFTRDGKNNPEKKLLLTGIRYQSSVTESSFEVDDVFEDMFRTPYVLRDMSNRRADGSEEQVVMYFPTWHEAVDAYLSCYCN